jgi:hypothetical protein
MTSDLSGARLLTLTDHLSSLPVNRSSSNHYMWFYETVLLGNEIKTTGFVAYTLSEIILKMWICMYTTKHLHLFCKKRLR